MVMVIPLKLFSVFLVSAQLVSGDYTRGKSWHGQSFVAESRGVLQVVCSHRVEQGCSKGGASQRGKEPSVLDNSDF